jgi:hypothetical protein
MLAAQVAKGRAIDNAQRLESTHGPFEVSDGSPSSTSSATPAVMLPRSATTPAGHDMPRGSCHFCVATDIPLASDAVQWEQVGEYYISRDTQPANATGLMNALLSAAPDARIAFDVTVSDNDSPPQAIVDTLNRLVQSASNGSAVATSSAAMMMKAQAPDISVEPLGELPGSVGASGVYAIGSTSGQTKTYMA